MEKAIITRQQAEALETLMKKAKMDAGHILENKNKAQHPRVGYQRERTIIAHIPLMILAKALVNGYEIESTPHEKLAEVFKDPPVSRDEWEQHYYRLGIKAALFILDIKVEGINVGQIHD